MVDRPGVGSVFGDADDDDFEIAGGSDGGNAPKPQAKKSAVTPPVRKPGVPSAVPSPATGATNPLNAIRRTGTGASLPSAPRRAGVPNPVVAPVTPAKTGLPTPPVNPARAHAPGLPTTPPAPTVPTRTEAPATTPEPVATPTPTVPEPTISRPEPVVVPEPVPVVEDVAVAQTHSPSYPSAQDAAWGTPDPEPVSRPRPRVVDEDDEEDEYEAPRRTKKPAPKKGGKKSPAKKSGNRRKGDEEKPPSSLSGGRKGVVFFRWAVFGLMLLLAFLGAKSILAPPSFPGPQQVVNRVKEGLGMTDFPVESGKGFVLGFARAYLQYEPDKYNERDVALRNYAPDGVLSNIRLTFAGNQPVAQKITAGPFITGSRSIDDKNAVYTISAEINGASWVYVEVPLYYDPENRGFAVSGSPAFVGPPTQAEVPAQPLDGIPDDQLGQEVQERLERFFAMWGSSDISGLDTLLTPDADPRARYGLGGTVSFNNITLLTILEAKPDANPNIRPGRVQVTWGSPASPDTTYVQSYDITIEKLEDGRWYVKDIKGGVPSETAGGSTENTGKPAAGAQDDTANNAGDSTTE